MSNKRRGAWFAAVLGAAALAGAAGAQTLPDPLAPGAALAAEPAATPSAPAKSEPAQAKDEAKPERPRPHKAKPHEPAGFAVTVNNKRSVGLVDLTVGPAGDPSPKKVAGPLAFGRKTVIHIKRTKDCLYDIRGHFADDADTEQLGVELCKDKVINLTDD